MATQLKIVDRNVRTSRFSAELGFDRELDREKVFSVHFASPRNGQVCGNIYYHLRSCLEQHPTGHVVVNNAAFMTGEGKDSVRGGDVWYVSHEKVAPGPLPLGSLNVVPDLVLNVISPSDRWSQILANVVEYLDAGVGVVGVLDPEAEMVRLYYADRPELILAGDDPVRFPEQLPAFEIKAHQFFE